MRQIKFQAINDWTLVETEQRAGLGNWDSLGNPYYILDGIVLLIDAPADGDIEKAIRDELIGMYGAPEDEDEREDFEKEIAHYVMHAQLRGGLLAIADPDAYDTAYERDTLRGWIERGITIDRDNVILTVEPGESADGTRVGHDNYGHEYKLAKLDSDEWEELNFDVEQVHCDYWDMRDFSRGDDFKKVIFK